MILPQPWQLRCGTQFLDEVAEALYDGIAWTILDASSPEGMLNAVEQRMQDEYWRFDRVPPAPCERKPLVQLGELYHVAPNRLSLATSSLNQHAVVLNLNLLPYDQRMGWSAFVQSYAATRRDRGAGLSILVIADTPAPDCCRCVTWQGRIRRADSGFWADIHAVADRPGPLGDLVHATAIELFGWRLDLARAFIQAGRMDVLSPMDWLERRTETAKDDVIEFNGKPFECPLYLQRNAKTEVLRNRLWRAQLTAVFPWIEEQRQAILEKYVDALEVPDLHSEKFKVTTVMDLEISEIARQLRLGRCLSREHQDSVDALGALRKDLAHRRPVKPKDLGLALRLVKA